jgi:hypothetical protein
MAQLERASLFIELNAEWRTVCSPANVCFLCDKVSETEAKRAMSTTDPVSQSDEFTPAQIGLIRDHLNQVRASPAFAGSKRAQDFLQLIVDHALAGRHDSLRERMIGAEMFGRPIDYDTANDAVVRVKATEVRKKLAQYYQEARETPVVRIDLPIGSYIPKFYWQSPETPAPAQASFPPVQTVTAPALSNAEDTAVFKSRLRKSLPLLIAAFLGVLAIAGYMGFKIWSGSSAARPSVRSIVILPMENLSGDARSPLCGSFRGLRRWPTRARRRHYLRSPTNWE